MNEQEIRNLIEQIFDEKLKATQYGFNSVPFHVHNQTDSPKIPPTSVLNFTTLPANNAITAATSGVLSTTNIGNSTAPYGIVYPLPIIDGYGVAGFSQFNEGIAPRGSVVLFQNGDTIPHSLHVMMETAAGAPAWYGIDLGTGLTGVKTYYVADSSGGAVTRKLTFVNGILISET